MNIAAKKREQLKKNLYDYLKEHAESDGDRSYLVTECLTVTYREALNAVDNLGAELLGFGVKKGDLVAVRATRTADTALVVLALCSVGAVVVATDAHFPVRDYLKNTGVEMAPQWFATDERAGRERSWSDEWALESADGRRLEIRFDFQRQPTPPRAVAIAPDDPFMIIFTSGSTGKSKAVVLSHKNCIANPVDAMPLFEEDRGDRAIALLPLNHVFGFAVIACATFCGHDVVFPASTKIEHILGCIEKFAVSVVYSVPTFFLELIADDRHKNYDLSSLRLGLMAGGPFTANQMRYIEGELGLQLMPGYGMSECVGISTMQYGDDVEDRAAGVGRLYPMTEAYILDENGDEVMAGETGEICVRGATQMLGYYGNAQETESVVDGFGRLHTGDLGYFDGNGILHVCGRKKDIIIRGGENISAGKIENALLSIGGVVQAAVVGLADEKYGEVPVAAVMLAKGVRLSEGEIKAALCGALSKHEIPRTVKVVESFPKTSSGKIDKIRCKELF